jgi:hypothetical protein
LIKLLENDPVAYACSQLKSARIATLLGTYKNENKEHLDFINYNLANMDETLQTAGGKHGSACPLGFSLSEVIFKDEYINNKLHWVLKGFNFLNPAKCKFRVKAGNPVDIRYNDGYNDVYIPYWKVIHVVNSLNTSFSEKSLYGSPEMNRAYPYIKLKQLIFGQLAVAARNRAGGILVGRTESSQKVPSREDPNKLVSSVKRLAADLAALQTNNIVVTDKMNELSSLDLPSGEQFWNFAKNLVDQQIMRSFMIPEMIWNEGSGALGVGSLSNTQLSILDSSLIMVVQLIRDQLIEKVIRPLIYFNFGKQADYGKFEFTPENDTQKETMITQTLLSALSSGIIQPTDYEAINSFRNQLGLNPLDPHDQLSQMILQRELQSTLDEQGSEDLQNNQIPAEE